MYTVTLKEVDGKEITPDNHTSFQFDLKDRAYSQSYAVGGQIGGGVKILAGVDLDVEDGFELSKSGNFFTGPEALGLSISRQITFKRKAEAKLSLAFKTPLIAAKAELSGGATASSPVTFTDSFSFPYRPNANPLPGAPPFILEFDAHCAIARLTTDQLASKNPAINKIADLLREQPCGDPNKFAKSHAVKSGASLNGNAGLELGFQSPLFGRVGNSRPTLGVNFGLSGTASVSIEHETSVGPDAAGEVVPTGFKTSIGLFGQIELSGSLGLSLDDTIQVKRPGAPPAAPQQEREDFFALKSIKRALAVSTSKATGGALGLEIEQAEDGVVDKVSLSFAQPKSYGWNAVVGGDGAGFNKGFGVGTSISFSLSRTEDKVAALERMANLEALAKMVNADGSEAALLTLTPTRIDDEMSGLRVLLMETVSTYQITEIEGSGIELPFGFEGQLGKIGLSANLSFKGDSKMAWASERGVNYKGAMLPLQTYTRDQYLPAMDMGLRSFVAQMWESVNASFGPAYSFVGAIITPGTATVLRSPNTAILTIDGTTEPEAFEASLYSYKFREIPGPVSDAPALPSATSGPAGQPHYGVGGFHHFGPLDRPLGAPTPLVIDYKDPDIIGLDEGTFGIYGWNEETKDWDHMGGTVDQAANTVSTTVNRLRLYTIAPAMPARSVELTSVFDGTMGTGESAVRRFTVTSAPLVMNNGQAVPDGTTFTVRSVVAGSTDDTQFGTVLTADADAGRKGTQVTVVNGRIEFQVEYSSPLGLAIPGRVIVHSTTGTAFGELVLVGPPPGPGGRP
jgi:hypothetical protein